MRPARPHITESGTRRARRRAAWRRGVTLLEVVLAVLMLGLVSASIASALAFTMNMDARADLRLSAYEIANRVMLQYLDERTALPDPSRPLDYGRYRFFWEARPVRVEMRVKPADATSGRATPRDLNRFELVTVRVWAAIDPMGRGGGYATKGEELAVLTRLLDPPAPRNPDAARRMATPGGISDLMQRMGMNQSGDVGRSSGGTGNGRNNGNPAPGTGGGRTGGGK